MPRPSSASSPTSPSSRCTSRSRSSSPRPSRTNAAASAVSRAAAHREARTPISGRNGIVDARTCRKTVKTSAHSSPNVADSCSRSRRASAGDAPPVEMARTSSPRRTIDGAAQSQLGMSSMTFTRTPRSRASRAIADRSAGSSDQATHTNTPSRSSGRHTRRSTVTRSSSAASDSSRPAGPSAMTDTRPTSAASNPSTLPSRTAPSPITTACRPASSRNTG